jgi:hypothetical protein
MSVAAAASVSPASVTPPFTVPTVSSTAAGCRFRDTPHRTTASARAASAGQSQRDLGAETGGVGMSAVRPTSFAPRIEARPGMDANPAGSARAIWSRSPRSILARPAGLRPPERTRFPRTPSTSGAARLRSEPPAPERSPDDRPTTSPTDESCGPNARRAEPAARAECRRGRQAIPGSRSTLRRSRLLMMSKNGRIAWAFAGLTARPARIAGKRAPGPAPTEPGSRGFRAAVSKSGVRGLWGHQAGCSHGFSEVKKVSGMDRFDQGALSFRRVVRPIARVARYVGRTRTFGHLPRSTGFVGRSSG